jgi:hypothetical protein
MLKLFLCLTILPLAVQSDPSAFYIEKIEANTKYDSRYIFNYAFQIIPQDRPVRESGVKSDIDCLVNELKASGIFEDVRAKLIETSKKNARKLLIDTVYHREIESFIVSEVALDNFPEVDKVKFQSVLNKKDVKTGIPLLKYYYSELEGKIGAALREAYPQNLLKTNKVYRIIIRPVGGWEVKLIVSSTLPRCN